MKKKKIMIGKWKLDLEANFTWGIGLGFDTTFHSWRSWYQWLSAHVVVGCFGFHANLTRPMSNEEINERERRLAKPDDTLDMFIPEKAAEGMVNVHDIGGTW